MQQATERFQAPAYIAFVQEKIQDYVAHIALGHATTQGKLAEKAAQVEVENVTTKKLAALEKKLKKGGRDGGAEGAGDPDEKPGKGNRRGASRGGARGGNGAGPGRRRTSGSAGSDHASAGDQGASVGREDANEEQKQDKAPARRGGR